MPRNLTTIYFYFMFLKEIKKFFQRVKYDLAIGGSGGIGRKVGNMKASGKLNGKKFHGYVFS